MENAPKKCRMLRHTDKLLAQALRYGLAAALGFLADYGLLALLTEALGWHYLLAVPLAFIAGIAVNYLVGVAFVFRRGRLSRAAELTGFLFISLAALGLTELTMYLFTGLLGLHPLVSRLLSGALTYLFNFLSRRFLLYGKPAETEGAAKDGGA
ncbi:MAG: GtrA family protein [Clostridia bacterium]|nr:GtrA family protein [Clostridia bacterium]